MLLMKDDCVVILKFEYLEVGANSVLFRLSRPANCQITDSVVKHLENSYSAVIKSNKRYIIRCSLMDNDELLIVSKSFDTYKKTSAILSRVIKTIILCGSILAGIVVVYNNLNAIKYCIHI